MNLKQFARSLLLTTAVVTLFATRVLSQDSESSSVDLSKASTNNRSSTQFASLGSKTPQVKPITEIRRLSQIEHLSQSARMLLVQSPTQLNTPSAQVVQVTGVKANPSKSGLELILQTSRGQQLQLVNRSAGKNFIVDIPSAQLRLPSGDGFTFRSTAPIAGVSEITVTNFNANTIRVTVIGKGKLPTVELFDSANEGLIFSVASTTPVAQQVRPSTQKPQTQQPNGQTQSTQQSSTGDEAIELVVRGEQDNYRVPDSTTATKTDTPQRDIPQAIQVVPRQVLQDEQITRVGDAVRNVSGVQQASSGPRSTFDRFYFRGFENENDGVLRNGLRDRIGSRVPSETANIERIEVLKGPGSVLYGQGILGGAINLITKQPLSNPFYAIEGTFGNFDYYRGAVDLSGPLNADKTLLYRLNAAVESSGTFIDFFDTQRYFISPVLSWQIDKNTKLTLEAEYLDNKQQDDNGLPAVGTVLPNPNGKIPLNRNVNEPSDKDNRTVLRVGYNLEHRFSENWQIRNAFQSTFSNVDQRLTAITGLDADNRTLKREFLFDSRGSTSTNTYTMDTYVVGKFKTGSIQHQLVTGFDLFRQTDFTPNAVYSSQAALDLFNPVYGLPQGPVTGRYDGGVISQALGIYIQDQITFADNLKLLLGGRFDLVNQKQQDFVASTTSFQQDQAFTPRVGIVYQPIQPISLYASYGQAFQQNFGTTLDNRLFTPERGTQYEVGVKADLSKQISATLAFYDLTRSNVLVTDPNNQNYSIVTGEQRSRGIELDVAGEILPGWNIIAAYAYTDAIVTRDTTFAVGNQLNNIPQNSFSVWTTYSLPKGDLKGLGFGFGLFYVGDRQGDLDNTFQLPSYLRTDAALFYKRKNFRVALNIKNLFDIKYFESSSGNLSVYPGSPLTVQGTIRWEF
ncbi:MAG: TonB-dependent receptor [Rhizonema sp. PD37]|nr:TonB-dependent receptor [Rhizonema sp. PD37]